MNEIEEVKLLALGQRPWEWVNHPCPFCKAEHEEKLGICVEDNNTIRYRCLRVSCGAYGVIGYNAHYAKCNPPLYSFKPKRWEYPLHTLSQDTLDILWEKYEISEHVARGQGWKETKLKELYCPIYSMQGEHVADSIKRFGEGRGPKTLALWFKDRPRLHFPVGMPQSNTCVLVEDILSATKVGQMVPSVALLGTHLGEDQALALRKRFTTLVFALDNDATDKAFKFQKQWGCLFNTHTVVMTNDPKDNSYIDLEEIFKRWRTSS